MSRFLEVLDVTPPESEDLSAAAREAGGRLHFRACDFAEIEAIPIELNFIPPLLAL